MHLVHLCSHCDARTRANFPWWLEHAKSAESASSFQRVKDALLELVWATLVVTSVRIWLNTCEHEQIASAKHRHQKEKSSCRAKTVGISGFKLKTDPSQSHPLTSQITVSHFGAMVSLYRWYVSLDSVSAMASTTLVSICAGMSAIEVMISAVKSSASFPI